MDRSTHAVGRLHRGGASPTRDDALRALTSLALDLAREDPWWGSFPSAGEASFLERGLRGHNEQGAARIPRRRALPRALTGPSASARTHAGVIDRPEPGAGPFPGPYSAELDRKLAHRKQLLPQHSEHRELEYLRRLHLHGGMGSLDGDSHVRAEGQAEHLPATERGATMDGVPLPKAVLRSLEEDKAKNERMRLASAALAYLAQHTSRHHLDRCGWRDDRKDVSSRLHHDVETIREWSRALNQASPRARVDLDPCRGIELTRYFCTLAESSDDVCAGLGMRSYTVNKNLVLSLDAHLRASVFAKVGWPHPPSPLSARRPRTRP